MEDEGVDVEPAVGHDGGHGAEGVGQRGRVRRRVDEDERAPRVDRGRAQAERGAVELPAGARRRAQRAVEPVRPRVVVALKRRAAPGARDDLRAAVAADVDQRAQHAVAVAHHHHGHVAGAAGEVGARLGHQSKVAGVVPRGGEQPRALGRQHLGVGVPAVGQRGGHAGTAAPETAWHAASRSGASGTGARARSCPRQRSSIPSRAASPEATSGQRGWKRQPGGNPRRVGRLAAEDLRRDVGDLRHDREQRARVGVARRGEDVLGRPLLDDPPEVHHGHAVGDVPRQPEVVGDDEDRDLGLAHEAQHQREDLAAHRRVEARDRLVGDEQARARAPSPRR